jgi:hypothetical protein
VIKAGGLDTEESYPYTAGTHLDPARQHHTPHTHTHKQGLTRRPIVQRTVSVPSSPPPWVPRSPTGPTSPPPRTRPRCSTALPAGDPSPSALMPVRPLPPRDPQAVHH